MDKDFYANFEAEFRGPSDLIKLRLKAYLNVIKLIQKSQIYTNRAIDLGCGRGEWLGVLSDNGFSAIGVDLDDGMLKYAIDHGYDALKQDALSFMKSQESSSCAIISAFHLIEHLDFEEFVQLVKECYRVLVPGGVVIFETPNAQNIFVASNTFFLDPTHNKILPAELIKFVLKTGKFHRSVSWNLQSPVFEIGDDLSLSDALLGVGYDLGVISQKQSDQLGKTPLDEIFRNVPDDGLPTRLRQWDYNLNSKLFQIEAELKKLRRLVQSQPVSEIQKKQNVVKKLLHKMYQNKSIREIGKRCLSQFPRLRKVIAKYILDVEFSTSSAMTDFEFTVKTVRRRYIYVDVTGLHVFDLKTGIQRVVREVLKNLYGQVSDKFSVVPVHAIDNETGFAHAASFEQKLTGANASNLGGMKIVPEEGDVFVGLDFQVMGVLRNHRYFESLCNHGIKVYFVVYDLLPIEFPHFFESNVSAAHEQWLKTICKSSGIICISQSVKNRFVSWSESNSIKIKKDFMIEHFALGADFNVAPVNENLTGPDVQNIELIASQTAALMVGTIEPRKGYVQVLDAFEFFWKSGGTDLLVIVGKKGWKMDFFTKRLENHPLKNVKLFWFESADDETLEVLYRNSDYYVAASYGEGFGLPLVEASRYGLPIFARDIDVFREVMGNNAHYFEGQNSSEFLPELVEYSNSINSGAIDTKVQKYSVSWKGSAKQFAKLIEG